MSNLDRVLDAAMELPLEQQEVLVQILANRIIESRRDEIASDAAVSISELCKKVMRSGASNANPKQLVERSLQLGCVN